MKRDKVIKHALGEENVLTPSDLYNHKFQKASWGGYKTQDVDAYLERLADIVESLNEQVKELKAENEDLREKVVEYQDVEKALRSSLLSSQRFHDEMLDTARQEAERMVDPAHEKKKRIEQDAIQVSERLNEDIRALRHQRERLRIDMQTILETHWRMLEKVSSDMPMPVIAIDAHLGGALSSPAAPVEETTNPSTPAADTDSSIKDKPEFGELPEAVLDEERALELEIEREEREKKNQQNGGKKNNK